MMGHPSAGDAELRQSCGGPRFCLDQFTILLTLDLISPIFHMLTHTAPRMRADRGGSGESIDGYNIADHV